MNDNVDFTFDDDSELENPSGPIRTDEHGEVIESKDPNRLAHGVSNIGVLDAVRPRRRNNDQIVVIKIN